jgi:hypothetical protein
MTLAGSAGHRLAAMQAGEMPFLRTDGSWRGTISPGLFFQGLVDCIQ